MKKSLIFDVVTLTTVFFASIRGEQGERKELRYYKVDREVVRYDLEKQTAEIYDPSNNKWTKAHGKELRELVNKLDHKNEMRHEEAKKTTEKMRREFLE